jgi:hypothetical protein
MKNLVIAVCLVSLTGCATLFAKKEVEVTLSDGASVNGSSTSTTLSKKESHTVTYQDGSTCQIESHVGWVWVVLDVFTTGPIGLIIDGVTGNWSKLETDCRGVDGEN